MHPVQQPYPPQNSHGSNGDPSYGGPQRVPLPQTSYPAPDPQTGQQYSLNSMNTQFSSMGFRDGTSGVKPLNRSEVPPGPPGSAEAPSFPFRPTMPMGPSRGSAALSGQVAPSGYLRAPQFTNAESAHLPSFLPSLPIQALSASQSWPKMPTGSLAVPKFPQPQQPQFSNGMTSSPSPQPLGSQQRLPYSSNSGIPQQNHTQPKTINTIAFANGPTSQSPQSVPDLPQYQYPQDPNGKGTFHSSGQSMQIPTPVSAPGPPQNYMVNPQQNFPSPPGVPSQQFPQAASYNPSAMPLNQGNGGTTATSLMNSGLSPPVGGMYPSTNQPYQGPFGGSGFSADGSGQMPMTNGTPFMGQRGPLNISASPMGDHAMQSEGGRVVNLLHARRILPPGGVELPKPPIRNDHRQFTNCSPEIFRCTLNAIPKSPALLQKSRLPLGILIHPFKDLSNLQVLSCNTIVRCRACRSYINPFVTFVDQQRWKCNLCDRTNDLPQEFFHDPVTHGPCDASRRPEVRTATIEYIAPQEYSLRPPQPAVYIFLLDISFNAIESRYLETFCGRLSDLLDRLPGDARTQIAIIAFDSALHFFQLEADWKMLTVADIDDVFVPTVDGILVRLHENINQVKRLLDSIPSLFRSQRETHSCTGAAIQIAHKLIAPSGGRITVLQTCLPSIGPGTLKAREDPNMRAAKVIKDLAPATDFYKTLALECSGNQVAVDLFLLAGQYADLASLAGIARYSAGSIHYYPGYNAVTNAAQVERFEAELTRYLTRKIGFEAVMRVRCTNGLSMHSFHGNFFVRSTDLLSLPNINPDAGYAVQVKMDETLNHTNSICFQAALLYTSSKGERRIRVHTLFCPVTESLTEVFACADQEAMVGLVGKIAAERAFNQPITDVRDGVVYACEDSLTAFTQIMRPQTGQLLTPFSLRLVPLFTQALLKCIGLRIGVSTTLDLRTYFLLALKAAPLCDEMILVYPHLYPVHDISLATEFLMEDEAVVRLERLHLSYENIDKRGVYLLEGALHMVLYMCKGVSGQFCRDVLDVGGYEEVVDRATELPEMDTEASVRLRAFVQSRYAARPMHPVLEIIKEDSKDRLIFLQYLHDDRLESTGSYFEFITQVSQKLKAP